MKIYMASKTRHATKWLKLRESGVDIISTWIDEAGPGQTKSFTDLWLRCINEVSMADRLIAYAEPGDELKGGLIEIGAALATGTPVYVVGEVEALKTCKYHPLITLADSLEKALCEIY